ncbi:MAG: hypothetical protein AAGA48_13835 [Myxococcota bacterium]
MIWLVLFACDSPLTELATTSSPSTPPKTSTEPETNAPKDSSDPAPTGMTGTPMTNTKPPCDLDDVERAPGPGWSDSYSVDGRCYCDTTYDHDIGDVMVDTPVGPRTVRQICEAIGPGPGADGNPVYNDVQCGNGPPNNAGDEDWCPGRVDQGKDGCCTTGPTWDLSLVQ